MAKASLAGSFMGLLTSIPLYYIFDTAGIVPAIIVTSVCTLSISWYFASKIPIPKVAVTSEVFNFESRTMLTMGFLISMSGLFNLATSYAERIFISNIGGLSDVGLFSAGFAIISTYVGMVFTAMSTDYYPRLAAVSNDNSNFIKAVNQQAEIGLLILAPILTLFLVFIKFGIVLLYSKSFLGILGMVQWATLGIYLKVLGWSIGFMFLAKGASKVFFWNEVIFNSYLMILNMGGYYFFGLEGLGASFLIAYVLYIIQVFVSSRKLYGFSVSKQAVKIFIFQFSLGIICFLNVTLLDDNISYVIGLACILASALHSWKELNKRIAISTMISNRLRRK